MRPVRGVDVGDRGVEVVLASNAVAGTIAVYLSYLTEAVIMTLLSSGSYIW
jgi:hypothetical protein